MMFPGIEKINDVIEHIEGCLASSDSKELLSCERLSKIAGLSAYEFRRIFSFAVGVPIAEYIRRRKMSLAASELKAGKDTVTDIGIRYGYDSPSSFTRAFKEVYGMTPAEAASSDVPLATYIRPGFEIKRIGGEVMECSIKKLGTVILAGYTGISPITDTCCCENVWRSFEEKAAPAIEMTGSFDGSYYAAYMNGENDVICTVGISVKEGENLPDGVSLLKVLPSLWACFDVPSEFSEEDIGALYNKIVYSWIPSSGYVRDCGLPNMEYFPKDGNGAFVIMIPVKTKE